MEKMIKSNELIKKDYDINRDSILLEEQKKYLINLLKKDLLIFGNQKKELIMII